MTFLTNSPEETEKLGEALALRLRPGVGPGTAHLLEPGQPLCPDGRS